MKKYIRQNKAITLIALVITIIVLLILTGVVIASLTGENGLLNRAAKTKDETEKSGVKDEVGIAYNSAQIDALRDKNLDIRDILASELKINRSNVRKNGEKIILTYKGYEVTIDTASGIITAKNISGNFEDTDKILFVRKEEMPGYTDTGNTQEGYDVELIGYKINITEPKYALCMNIYFTMPENKRLSGNEKIVITTTGDGVNLTKDIMINENTLLNETIDGNNYYYIKVNMLPTYATCNVGICAYNDSTKDSKEYTFIFKNYADLILSKKSMFKTSKDFAAENFIKATLDIGTFLQVSKNRNATWLANEGIENDTYSEFVTLSFLERYMMTVGDISNSKVKSVAGPGVNFSAEEEKMVYYISLKTQSSSDKQEAYNYEYYIDGNRITTESIETPNATTLRVKRQMIFGELDKVHHFEFKKNSELLGEVWASPYSFSYAMMTSATYASDPLGQRCAKAIILLNESFLEYNQ